MRILLTGCAGFLGSHFSRYLIKKGHSVIGIDNLMTGNLSNLDGLYETGRFTYVRANVAEHMHVSGKLDAVLHLASPASPADYLKYPIPTLKVGSLGTHNALGVARAKKARFLLASTSEVYGDPLVSPQDETYWGNVNTVGLRGVYDEAKRFAEAITMAYHRYHGMQVRIVRIFNTYGPNMRLNDGRAIPNFISQALQDRPITIYGNGKQTRSFMYVTDLIEGLYRLLMSNHNAPVNLGNPEEKTLLELAYLIKELTGSKSKLVFQDLPQDDPKVRCPDITLAKKILKWSPEVPLKDGLIQTIEYFRMAIKKRGKRAYRHA